MEERNIKISLDKAIEWYNRGGEYKELALSAFTEKEITESALPNTWEEFCQLCLIKDKEYVISLGSEIIELKNKEQRFNKEDRNILPSLKAAEAHLALMQLHQLRDCYRQDWLPDWEDDDITKYCIALENNRYVIYKNLVSCKFLSFQSLELAEKFLNNFKGLIETAGDLI